MMKSGSLAGLWLPRSGTGINKGWLAGWLARSMMTRSLVCVRAMAISGNRSGSQIGRSGATGQVRARIPIAPFLVVAASGQRPRKSSLLLLVVAAYYTQTLIQGRS
jgi:hypothetical protein